MHLTCLPHFLSTGVGYPTIYAYIMACSTMHRLLKLSPEDPTIDEEHIRKVDLLRKNHKTVHVSVLDVLEDLPYIRKAIFTDGMLSDAEKMMWWSLVLVALEHGCRISELSTWGPTLAEVGLPGELSGAASNKHAIDPMGHPKMIEITRTRWKGKHEADPDITQMLHANVVDGGAAFCSVTAVGFVLRYYNALGITTGPLWRKFTTDKKTGSRVPVRGVHQRQCQTHVSWYAEREQQMDKNGCAVYDDAGEKVYKYSGLASLSEDEVRDRLMGFFKEAATQARAEGNNNAYWRLISATPHSLRATMVGWAARSR